MIDKAFKPNNVLISRAFLREISLLISYFVSRSAMRKARAIMVRVGLVKSPVGKTEDLPMYSC